jgi:predicted nucleotidyltransferase
MAKINRDKAVSLLKLHKQEFHDASIGALYLFGSVARDQARETSDVDIFFDLDRPQGSPCST